jgi:hypothetical protein
MSFCERNLIYYFDCLLSFKETVEPGVFLNSNVCI